MQIKVGQSENISAKSGTMGGLMLYAYLQAALVNVALTPSMFSWINVQVNVNLQRNGVVIPMMTNNANLLGIYKMRKNNLLSFVQGQVLQIQAGGAKMILLRSAWLQFDSPITLQPGNELTAEVNFTDGGMTADIDAAVSYIDFSFQPSTLAEFGIPVTTINVVTAGNDTQEFIGANRVHNIHWLTLNKTTYATPVVTNASLLASGLKYSANYQQLIASENIKWPANQPYQYGTDYNTPSVVRAVNLLPQCFTIYEAGVAGLLLNNCSLQMNMNSANNTASQNWVAWSKMV